MKQTNAFVDFEHLKSDSVAPRIKRKRLEKKQTGILVYFFTVVRDYLNNAQWCDRPKTFANDEI